MIISREQLRERERERASEPVSQGFSGLVRPPSGAHAVGGAKLFTRGLLTIM